MNDQQQKGYVLIVVLLLLLVLIVIGLAALGTSSIENIMSGNMRLKARADAKTDMGAESSPPVIEDAVSELSVARFPNIVSDGTLPTELLLSFPNNAQEGPLDLAFVVDGDNVTVDIDRMYPLWCDASAITFAEGDEGIGYGGASGVCVYFRVNSTADDDDNTLATAGMIYKYKIRM